MNTGRWAGAYCRWLSRLRRSGSAALVLLPTVSHVSLAQVQQRFGKGPGSPSCPSSSSGCGEQKAQSPSKSFKVFFRFSTFRLDMFLWGWFLTCLKVLSAEHTPVCVWHAQAGNAERPKPAQRCCRFLCCASAGSLPAPVRVPVLAGICWLQPDIYIQGKTAFVKTYQWISFWGSNTANPTNPVFSAIFDIP